MPTLTLFSAYIRDYLNFTPSASLTFQQAPGAFTFLPSTFTSTQRLSPLAQYHLPLFTSSASSISHQGATSQKKHTASNHSTKLWLRRKKHASLLYLHPPPLSPHLQWSPHPGPDYNLLLPRFGTTVLLHTAAHSLLAKHLQFNTFSSTPSVQHLQFNTFSSTQSLSPLHSALS